MRKPKQHRATLKTDLSRLVICAVGCGLLSFSICGYLDDELGWPLGAVLGVGAAGLGMIGWGIFGKAKSVENVVDGI